jgi:hypothetical protein
LRAVCQGVNPVVANHSIGARFVTNNISDSDPNQDPHYIRIQWTPGSGTALRMRIRIQKGENQHKKRRKVTKSEDQKKILVCSIQSYFRQRTLSKNV